MKKASLFIVFSLILFSCTHVEFTESGIKDAFILAKQTNKKVFIVVGNLGCKKCDRFIRSLNKDSKAKEVLNEDFICLKVNQDEESGKEFSQITGCTFFPYSCFFDSNANLLNLRIGDKDFDFANIENNEVNIYTYRELFNLPISFSMLKKRTSLSMQSYLLTEEEQTEEKQNAALILIQQSLKIHPYPYNLFLSTQLSTELKDTLQAKQYKKQFKDIYTSYDEFLYSDLRNELGIYLNGYIKAKNKKNTEYSFSKEQLNLGDLDYKSEKKFEYKISNTSKEPLLIKLARANCSCTDLEWTKKPILPNETGYVKGVFHAKKKAASINSFLYI